MALSLAAGDIVHDYSWARPDLAEMQRQGSKAMVRYLSTDTTGKNVTAGELNRCAQLGLGMMLVWEQTGTRVIRSGVQGGAEDVAIAVRQAQSLPGGYKYPEGATILFANDTDTTSADLPNVFGYFDSVFAGIGPYKVGVYAEFEVIEALKWAGYPFDLFWQCSAWSGTYVKYNVEGRIYFEPKASNISPSAHVLQRVGHMLDTSGYGGITDENRWLRSKNNIWVPGRPFSSDNNGDVDYKIITVTGAKATFLGYTFISPVTGITLVPTMEWVDGADPLKLARFQALSPHLQRMEIPLEACRNIAVDVVPQGDSARTWSRSDFGNVLGAGATGSVDVNAIVARSVAAVQPQIDAVRASIPTKATVEIAARLS